jgi:hypothetical protein
MSYTFLQDFEDRKRQVRHYLAVVAAAERDASLGASHVQQGRLLTLRAGTFLVLYNLVEATIRAAVEAIHDKITATEVEFGLLKFSLRKEVVRRFKKQADPAVNHTMDDFPSAFVAVALDQGIKLAGTVDAKAIRELGLCYGFSCETTKAVTRDGTDLLTVKRNRNELAHGRKTFEDVGRDYTSVELALLARRSMRYMGEILNNIASYLDEESYLEKAADVRDDGRADGPPEGGRDGVPDQSADLHDA